MTLERSDVGAWLFKCSPEEWDIQAALRDRKAFTAWRVHPTYRLRLIESGDPAVLWVTGRQDASMPPGIWLAGHTTGELFEGRGDEYWLDPREGQRWSTFAGLRLSRLPKPLTRMTLAADPATSDMEVLRQPQMSNPSYLTPVQHLAVERMIGTWPSGA